MKKLALFSRYRLYRGAGEWTPVSLFDGGVQGAIYDPSYLNTYMSGLGPELVTNGDFSSGSTGWAVYPGLAPDTFEVVGGELHIANDGSTRGLSGTASAAGPSVVAGVTYKVTFTLRVVTASGNASVQLNANYFSISRLSLISNIASNYPVGTYEITRYYTATNTELLTFSIDSAVGAVSDLYFDNISVKEVTTIGNATMFTTSAGTTPVTAVEQNVGLILDQSQGGVGPELVTNGGFSSSSNWTLSNTTITGGNLVFGVAFGYASQAISGTAGTYKLLVDKSVGFAGAGNLTFAFYNAGSIVGSAISIGSTTLTFGSGIVTASGSFDEIRIVCSTTDAYQVNSVSLIRAPGNHAYVTADANRGILRSRFNQLTYSEQFDNAVWTKSNSFIQSNLLTYSELFENAAWTKSNSFVQTNLLTYSTLAGAVAGTPGTAGTDWGIVSTGGNLTDVTADTGGNNILTFASSAARVYFTRAYAVAANTTYTYSATINSNTGILFYECVYILALPVGATMTFFANGVLVDALTYVPVANDRLSIVLTVAGTSGTVNVRIGAGVGGAVTGTVAISRPQLVQGSVPGNYQATTSAAAAIAYANWDGTLTARNVPISAATAVTSVNSNAGVAVSVGTFTVSCYVKANGVQYASVGFIYSSGIYSATQFDLTNGTVVRTASASYTSPSATITPLSNGWYRCTHTATVTTTTIFPFVSPSNALWTTGEPRQSLTGDGTSGIYISDSQLVQGSVPGDYRATTASALPILYTDPFGGLTAQKVCEDTVNTNHRTSYAVVTTLVTGASYPLSIYVKAGERQNILLLCVIGGGYVVQNFNVSTGTIQSAQTVGTTVAAEPPQIASLGNGWYRCTMVVNVLTGGTATLGWDISQNDTTTSSYTGNGSSGIYIWGGQLVPTDVFPTNTYQRIAAATDYATGPAFPLYIQTDGTNDAMLTNTINFANGPSSPPLGPELVTGAASAYSGNGTVATVGDTITATCTTNGIYGITWTSSAVSNLWALCTFEVVTNSASKFMFVFLNGNAFPFAAGNTTGNRSFIAFAPTATGSTARPIFYINGLVGESFSVRLVSIKEMDSAYAPDKMTVTAGVTKFSGSTGMLAELSASADTNNGSWSLLAPRAITSGDYGLFSKGTTLSAAITANNYPFPITNVLAGICDISGDRATLQVNGNQVAQSTTDQGTGTYGNYPLYLFARGNASLYFNGYFYGAVVVQKYLSAGELASLTNWMEVRTFGKDMAYSYDYLTLANGDSVTLDNGDPVYTNIYYS